MRSTTIYMAVGAMASLATGSNIGESPMNMLIGRDKNLIPRAIAINLMTFIQSLGGVTAPPITSSGDSSRPFAVDDRTFTTFSAAYQRSCNNQHNSCADFANSAAGKSANVTVGDCDTQEKSCAADVSKATATTFPVLTSSNAEFDFFCDP
ncbi:hypothetical protein BJ878DRAFT_87897 [Calycina marina]|uniref:Uncharacterized protein n=1 Tax=Calycina marina TaxID=1763456 RepID=A0A9P8CEG0_9HELO|nr:hypothetical protein BJ878DRAFT_87897 [Calycina marina]